MFLRFPWRLAALAPSLLWTACTLTANLDSLKGGHVDDAGSSGGSAGQPDAGQDADSGVEKPVPPVVGLSAGGLHGCLVDAVSDVYCWGSNLSGELGAGKSGGSSGAFVRAQMPEPAITTTAGGQHSCAIGKSGKLYCWGSGSAKQLGVGTGDLSVPTEVPGIAGVTQVSAGANHTCAIATGTAGLSTVFCWGSNASGQLGLGGASASKPTAVGLPGASSIAAGTAHTCAAVGAEVHCWGDNSSGQLGDGTTTTQQSPVTVTLPGGASVLSIAAGGKHTCAATTSGVLCWGNNLQGQVGVGQTSATEKTPVSVPSIAAKAVALGDFHSCAVTPAGAAECWGGNDKGQVGDGSGASATKPVALSLSSVTEIATGTRFSCALAANGGALWCWGDNEEQPAGQPAGNQRAHARPATVLKVIPRRRQPRRNPCSSGLRSWRRSLARRARGSWRGCGEAPLRLRRCQGPRS